MAISIFFCNFSGFDVQSVILRVNFLPTQWRVSKKKMQKFHNIHTIGTRLITKIAMQHTPQPFHR